jgi:hypothetical protein
VDAASALADLLELSSHVDAAILVEADGSFAASTLASEAAGDRLARAGLGLLDGATERIAPGGRTAIQVEAALREGSVYAVRDGARTIVARTPPKAPSLLVFYDLRACLQAAGPPKAKRRRAASKKVERAADA